MEEEAGEEPVQAAEEEAREDAVVLVVEHVAVDLEFEEVVFSREEERVEGEEDPQLTLE